MQLPTTIKVDIAPSGLMSIESAAIYLGVSVASVRWMIRTRKIPFCKLGKFLKFRQRDLDLWIENSMERSI